MQAMIQWVWYNDVSDCSGLHLKSSKDFRDDLSLKVKRWKLRKEVVKHGNKIIKIIGDYFPEHI